ncbi:MAG TPA: alpha/beta fold hydrolase [Burkholderiales bacterium]|jgi:pimeloyl-ACP methyl ester carboxylesterase|nr:alpha/beta fold hydrolase [Burkholderiales bacterium]
MSDDQFCETPHGLRLCFRLYGASQGETVLLIAGLGLQLIYWPPAFLEALAAEGLRLVAVDNRDAGRSSPIGTRPPGRLRQLFARPPRENYTLEDMADDMACLLRHLELASAHVVGMSMGGMIAQALACRHRSLVRSLTSIFSTTGRRSVGQPAASTLWRIATTRMPRSTEEAEAGYLAMMRHIGAPEAPGSEEQWRSYARQAWQRAGGKFDASGIARQIGAIQKSGDRTAALRRIEAPTLVVHGDVDRIVHPSGGRATAKAIPGARLVTLKGMRHDIDAPRIPALASLIVSNIRSSGLLRP